LVPYERIRYTDKFDDPHMPGDIQVTITLKKVSCGTELHIVQEGMPAVIPPEACYLGWQESLILLAKLVEAELPNQRSCDTTVLSVKGPRQAHVRQRLHPETVVSAAYGRILEVGFVREGRRGETNPHATQVPSFHDA